jgi:hypothetical protein
MVTALHRFSAVILLCSQTYCDQHNQSAGLDFPKCQKLHEQAFAALEAEQTVTLHRVIVLSAFSEAALGNILDLLLQSVRTIQVIAFAIGFSASAHSSDQWKKWAVQNQNLLILLSSKQCHSPLQMLHTAMRMVPPDSIVMITPPARSNGSMPRNSNGNGTSLRLMLLQSQSLFLQYQHDAWALNQEKLALVHPERLHGWEDKERGSAYYGEHCRYRYPGLLLTDLVWRRIALSVELPPVPTDVPTETSAYHIPHTAHSTEGNMQEGREQGHAEEEEKGGEGDRMCGEAHDSATVGQFDRWLGSLRAVGLLQSMVLGGIDTADGRSSGIDGTDGTAVDGSSDGGASGEGQQAQAEEGGTKEAARAPGSLWSRPSTSTTTAAAPLQCPAVLLCMLYYHHWHPPDDAPADDLPAALSGCNNLHYPPPEHATARASLDTTTVDFGLLIFGDGHRDNPGMLLLIPVYSV